MFKKTSHTLSLLFRITQTPCANISFPLEQKSASVLQFCRRYIGCGIGRWCPVAAKYAKRVVGVDYDEEWIRIARETTTAENVEYILGDATKELKRTKIRLGVAVARHRTH